MGHSAPIENEGSGTGGGGGGNSTIIAPLGRQSDAASVSSALSTQDVALLSSIITLLNGGLPAALGSGGGLKTEASQGESAAAFLSTNTVISSVVKNAAGTLTGLEWFKIAAGRVFVRLYNQTTTPASTDTPVMRFVVPGSTAGDAGGFTRVFLNGVIFTVGIGVRVTAAVADNDTTALAANDVIGNIEYI